jgi:hypothetical protein
MRHLLRQALTSARPGLTLGFILSPSRSGRAQQRSGDRNDHRRLARAGRRQGGARGDRRLCAKDGCGVDRGGLSRFLGQSPAHQGVSRRRGPDRQDRQAGRRPDCALCSCDGPRIAPLTGRRAGDSQGAVDPKAAADRIDRDREDAPQTGLRSPHRRILPG